MSEVPQAEMRQAVIMWQNIDEEALPEVQSESGHLNIRKETLSTATQTDMENMAGIEEPTKNWKALAEERRVALAKALDDNELLHNSVISLTEQNAKYKDMLEEANSFIEVCKGLLEENADDTGIDLGDDSDDNGTAEI